MKLSTALPVRAETVIWTMAGASSLESQAMDPCSTLASSPGMSMRITVGPGAVLRARTKGQ